MDDISTQKRYCLFDFDGTLVDSFYKGIEKLNSLADEFGFKKILPDKVLELKDFNSREVIQYLKIPLYKLPSLIYRARKEIQNEIFEFSPFIGIYEMLNQLNKMNIHLGIVTSNSVENVKSWLKLNKMDHFFQFVYSASNLFGKDKVIKKILKNYQINKEQVCFVGDETRDIEAAKKSAITSIAVTWGFNSEDVLLKSEPHYLIKDPKELITILSLL